MSIKSIMQGFIPSSSRTFHRRMDELESIIESKKHPTQWDRLYLECLSNEIADLHKKSFSEFRNINRNRDVVVVGSIECEICSFHRINGHFIYSMYGNC